jgi:Protein of unknown function (DUF4012)
MVGTETEAMRTQEPRRRRPARVVLIPVLGVLALAVAGAAIVAFATMGIRPDLERGRRALEDGRRALLAGDVGTADRAFIRARTSFARATSAAGSGLGTLADSVPVLGRTFDVATALADAGRHAAAAGLAITDGIGELPGGIDALAPTGGALPVDAFGELAGSLERAGAEAERAVRLVRSSPDSLLPGPVRDARDDALGRIEEIRRVLRTAGEVSRAFPVFAGVDRPRRYLFMAENPAELRGTGGLWGAFSIVQVEDGRFTFSRFRPVQSLPNLPPAAVSPPNPEYRTNYGQWGAPGYWPNINMTPDFPSAAKAALALWQAGGGEPLDGVLTANPFALRHLLTVTGPVRVTRPPLAVSADNVVPLLSNRAFARFPNSQIRKAVLGDVARAVFERFLGLDGRTIPRLRAIGRAVAEGHLKVYTAHGAMESALVGAGLDRGLPRSDAAPGDFLGVVVNSGAGGKVDFFSRRTIRHDVRLLAGEAATASTSTTIENGAPTSGQPRYVIGPHVGEAGDNIPLVAVYCGNGCGLLEARRDGDRIRVFEGSELGYRMYRDYFTIPSGERRTLEVWTKTEGAWSGDALSGTYRLRVFGQTTIRPTEVDIRVEAPPGMTFTGWTDGIRVRNGVATWRGTLGDGTTLELQFEAPSLPVRVWQVLTPF